MRMLLPVWSAGGNLMRHLPGHVVGQTYLMPAGMRILGLVMLIRHGWSDKLVGERWLLFPQLLNMSRRLQLVNIPATNAAQTFSAWVHCTTVAAVMDIVVTENGAQGNQLRSTATGYLQVSQWGGNITVVATTLPLTTTGWYMVTWTSTGALAGQALYVNGVACAVTTTTALQTGTPTGVVIGSYDAGEYFNGDIDDVRIYNRVLTAADVAQLYMYTGKSGFFTLNSR